MQYCSADYVAALNEAGFAISMSRTGNPCDNAHVESFFKTLKYGEVHLADYETVEDVIERLPHFIGYNEAAADLGYRPRCSATDSKLNRGSLRSKTMKDGLQLPGAQSTSYFFHIAWYLSVIIFCPR